jgi:hypothetical protein
LYPALNRRLGSADNAGVNSLNALNSPAALLPYLAFWATLMRALFVRAQLLPATCARCGMQLERRELGESICTCAR